MRTLLCAVVLFACGDATEDDPPIIVPPEDAGPSDTGTPDAGFAYEIEPAAPNEPNPPNPPVLTPCPDGWRTVSRPDAPDICDPWPASGRQSCPEGEAHFVGTP